VIARRRRATSSPSATTGCRRWRGAGSRARQIEAGRIAAQHYLKREGKIFIRVFPDKPVAKKPLETRMGKGKADVDYWAARVKPGTVLYELAGVSESRAREAFSRVAMKMPVRCRFVGRRLSA
jgi:large subunit ribosomal protein L16